jgi:DNA replication initiation complex subunit (GINS family)
MYNELYTAWRRELGEAPLAGLPRDFYVKVADYLKNIREENKQIDKKSVKVNLLDHEANNVKLMLDQLLKARYRKLLKTISQNQTLPTQLLTVEEAQMCESFAAFASAYQEFTRDLLQGEISQNSRQPVAQTSPQPQIVTETRAKPEVEVTLKRVALRFTKNIPAIMGADMKSYGPFIVEDVASLPAENAKILVKQGLAVLVEVS